MKALDILRNLESEIRNNEGIINWDCSYEYLKKVEFSIKELEDLQNRSCSNCKYNKEQDGFMIFCDKEMCKDGSKMMWHSFTKDFCCKFWEPK